LKRIKLACGKLKGAKGKAVKYIAENSEVAAFLSISELAAQIGTSPSTLTRTATALGYANFVDMQKDVQDYIRQHLRATLLPTERMDRSPAKSRPFSLGDSFDWDIKNIQSTFKRIPEELFDRAVVLLREAERIYVVGMGTQFSSASFFSTVMGQIRDGVSLVPQAREPYQDWIAQFRPEDVFVNICLPRYAMNSVMVTREAARAGCRIIAITDSELSPSGRVGDIVFTVEYESMSFFNSNAATMVLLDALATAVALSDVVSSQKRLLFLNEIATRCNIFCPQSTDD
jgi:DNA-binding MurR/RpiR family transcriptional regulator